MKLFLDAAKARVFSLVQAYHNAVFFAALCLAVLPLWVTTFPPIVDIAQHASQIASLREWLLGNPFYRQAFEVNWFTPYLGGQLLILAAHWFLPIGVAVKLVLSLAVMGIPWMTGMLLRHMGGDERLKWLAIPCSYCFAFYYGLFSYLVAVPFGLVFMIFAVYLDRKPSKTICLSIAGCSLVLFFFHLVVLGFASLISLAYLAARNLRNPKRLILLWLPYTTPIPLIIFWMVQAQINEPSLRNEPVVFAGIQERTVHLVTQIAGMDGYGYWISLFTFCCVIGGPYLAGYRPSLRMERWLPFVVAIVVYFTFPAFAQNTAFLYQRLAVFLVPMWVLLWDAPPKTARCFWPAVGLALILWSSANTYRFAVFEKDTKPFAKMVASIEPCQRVGGLMLNNTHPLFAHPVLLHLPAWYQALGGGLTDMSFAATHPSIIRYPDLERGRIDEVVLWEPHVFRREMHGADAYDYFLVCAHEFDPAVFFSQVPIKVDLVRREGNWWLFQHVRSESQESSDAGLR